MSAVVVVKLGGAPLGESTGLLGELAELHHRLSLVVVHGGGNRVTSWLERLGVPTRFEEGRRVTDEATLEVATAVLRGAVNVELVAALRLAGADAVGISGVDGGLLAGRRLAGLGRVAAIAAVHRELLDTLLDAGRLPVVAPLALDEGGAICNVNADDVAVAIARGLGAAQLILLTDTDGVRDAAGRRLATLEPHAVAALVASGVIDGGMIPKVRAALDAVADGGAGAAVIADGSVSGAIGRALGDQGFGSRALAATRAEAR
ncbi:MAG: acetylglutamate kinase [Candidatus Limnocylindrales bacterium]